MTTTQTRPAPAGKPPGGLLAEALAAMPDVPALDAAIGRVKRWRAGIPQVVAGQADAALLDELAAAALAGDDPGIDIPARALEANRRNEAGMLATQALTRLIDRLTNQRDAAVSTGVDHGFAVVRDRYTAFLAELPEVLASVEQYRDADAIVRAGDTDAMNGWRRLAEMVTEYADIRRAQARLTESALGHSVAHGLVQRVGEVANPSVCWPRFAWASGRETVPGEVGHKPPWPTDADPARQRYTISYLRWLAQPTDDAAVWLPTPDELQRADDLNNRIRERRRELWHRIHDAEPGEPPRPGRINGAMTELFDELEGLTTDV